MSSSSDSEPSIRSLSPYEQNHLIKYGFDPHDIARYGEMPVEYITGFVEFCGRECIMTPDVLIPRIETEELVRLASDHAATLATQLSSPRPLIIADVGTGSGAIGICVFLELQKRGVPAEMYLSEVSAAALEVARQNVTKLIGETAPFHLFESDLLSQYPNDFKADLFVANLPYIPTGRINSLDASVKDHEPWVALDGGEDGLGLIKQFLTQAHSRLHDHGRIILELDYTHTTEEITTLVPGYTGEVILDQFTRNRFGILKKKK